MTEDDSDVSDCCDLGAHERCIFCGCGCHDRAGTPFKVCRTCHREYSQEQWDELPLLGRQMTEDREFLELRNCACGSTMAIEVEAD